MIYCLTVHHVQEKAECVPWRVRSWEEARLLTKHKIKTLSPLRSSDRRKIADQIISDFHIEVPEHNTDQQSHGNEMPSGGLSATRSSLLPDNALSGRFTTTVGPDLRPVNGTVYVGVHAEEEQRILWVKIEERMYPTGL